MLGATGWLRFVWRQLTSMNVALMLLLLLAIAALPGSALPQRNIDAGRVRRFIIDNPTLGPILDDLGFFSVYSSVWFSAIYLLLFVSLVGCIIPRTKVYWTALRSEPVKVPARLERLPGFLAVSIESTPQDAVAAAERSLRAARYRVRREGQVISAERGYLREGGNLVFHIALVGVLLSMATSYLFAYNGQKLLPVGETFVHSTVGYDSFSPGSQVDPEDLPPFSITLNHFFAEFEDTAGSPQFAQPRVFDSSVTVTDTDGQERTEPLRVNHPVDVDGASIYLVGNGYAPVLTVRDGDGNVAFSGPVPMLTQDGTYTSTGVVKVPDANPAQLGLQAIFLPTAAEGEDGLMSVFPKLENPELIFSLFAGDLGLDRGAPQNAYRLDTRRMEQITVDGADGGKIPFRARIRPGDIIELPQGYGEVQFEGVREYVGLQIRHDPGLMPILVSSILALMGITAALFVRRRRVFVRVAEDGNEVLWAGLSDSDDPTLDEHLRKLSGADRAH